MSEDRSFATHPTSDQIVRFRGLSTDERYRWLAGMLTTLHGLASSATKARWRARKQAGSGGFLSIASGFALALDAGDVEDAAHHLASGCIYETGTATHTGVDEIV